jgi:hypothetical protein
MMWYTGTVEPYIEDEGGISGPACNLPGNFSVQAASRRGSGSTWGVIAITAEPQRREGRPITDMISTTFKRRNGGMSVGDSW